MAKILICTGIYPPQIGGPAQYAKEVTEEFRREGHDVRILTFGLERKMPTLVRHEFFFWRTFWALLSFAGKKSDDFVLALDTFSVAWPSTIAAKILGKKIVIRTGGDFLWESYVERTGDLVLLRNFYQKSRNNWNLKEKIIFTVTKWTLQNADAVIFSTEWQKKIFEPAYQLNPAKSFIVENFYGPKIALLERDNKVIGDFKNKKIFVAGTRPLKWKNIEILKKAFSEVQMIDSTIQLDTAGAPYDQFFAKISQAYALILVSLGDISPNMILDALRTNTPFILTKETGLYDRLKDVALFVDPENHDEIKEKILFLADPKNYNVVKEKIEGFRFTHSWSEICQEILEVVERSKK